MASAGTEHVDGKLPAFREGFMAPWEGLRFMNRSPHLWRFAALPVFLNLLITGLILTWLVLAGIWYARELHPRFAGSGWMRGVEVLAILGIFAVVLALALAVWLLLQNILCGYFYAKLARHVELHLGLPPEAMTEVSLGREIWNGARDAAALLAVNGGFLLLHVVPVIGSIVATAGSLYYDCWLLGLDYLKYPLGLRGRKPQEIRQFAKSHRPQTLGLGAAVLLMALVPVISAVFLTTAATGAVLLHRRLANAAPPVLPTGVA